MYDAECDAYGTSRCFMYVCMMNGYVMQMLECFDESTVCLCRLHCLYEGLMETMIALAVSLSAPEYGGALFRRRARRADESRPSGVSFRVFVRSRYSHGGIVLVGVSFQVFIGVALFSRQARRVDESHPSGVSFRVFVGSRYSHGGVVLVGVSFRVFIKVALFARRARRANESRPSGVSFRVFIGVALFARRGNLGRRQLRALVGSRYSLDRLAEPMNRVRPASATELSSGRIIRSAG